MQNGKNSLTVRWNERVLCGDENVRQKLAADMRTSEQLGRRASERAITPKLSQGESTGVIHSPWRTEENYAVMRMFDKEANGWQSVARSLSPLEATRSRTTQQRGNTERRGGHEDRGHWCPTWEQGRKHCSFFALSLSHSCNSPTAARNNVMAEWPGGQNHMCFLKANIYKQLLN